VKLNYKRTLLVGFAFFLICAFWQAYDTIIPKILTDRFGMTQTVSGIIMALDNILALFMLPLFGTLSDKCRHKWGKRKPFVFYGTIVAVAALMLLTVSDACQLKLIESTTKIDDAASLCTIYDKVGNETVKTPDGDEFVLSERYSREQFSEIKSKISETKVKAVRIDFTPINAEDSAGEYNYCMGVNGSKIHFVTYDGTKFWIRERNDQIAAYDGGSDILDIEIEPVIEITDEAAQRFKVNLYDVFNGKKSTAVSQFKQCTNTVYTNYVTPARQAYIATMTEDSPIHLIFFVLILLILLVAMSTFRSPAVALMPDVTIKPLRSKANAIINLMGTFGGMAVLVLGMGFAFNNSAIENTFRPYVGFFAAVAGIMLVCLALFMLFVKEPKWSADMVRESEENGIDENEPAEAGTAKGGKLSRGELISLILILASVALWYFGYNAVTSKYSVYATNVLDLDYSTTLLIANAAAVVSYLPVGIISSKVGRKKTILAGVLMLTLAFLIASFMRVDSPAVVMNVMFALAGIGWATINVNSFPMVVELSKNGDIGKYTGYYYAASMAAQALTPFLSGIVMDNFGMTWLFPYATVFVALAFVTMLFVKHGDSKPEQPKSRLEAFDVDAD